jgi:hypothetical protein
MREPHSTKAYTFPEGSDRFYFFATIAHTTRPPASLAFCPEMLMFFSYRWATTGPNPEKGGNPHGPEYLLAG